MDANKTTTNWIIAGLVALVVIIGGGWLIARERSGTTAGANATSTEVTSSTTGTVGEDTSATQPSTANANTANTGSTNNPTAMSSGEHVSVSDQTAGDHVMVSDVTITKPSWIAVRDTRGWYPGAKWLSAGAQNVDISLLRSTEAGRTYEVVIFVDDGDKKFSIHGGDQMLTSTQGAPVSSTFTAQ